LIKISSTIEIRRVTAEFFRLVVTEISMLEVIGNSVGCIMAWFFRLIVKEISVKFIDIYIYLISLVIMVLKMCVPSA